MRAGVGRWGGESAILLLSAIALSGAGAPTPTYGEYLAASAMLHFSELSGLRIDATGADGATIAVTTGLGAAATKTPLRDAMGRAIGFVSIAWRKRATPDPSEVAAYLARRIYSAETLREPEPFVADAKRAPYAQQLVERVLDDDPDLVTLAMHVAARGGPNAIIASNFGRVGKPADADDQRVIATGAVLRETTDGGARLAVELPLLDRRGRRIGALSTSLKASPDTDQEPVYRHAVAIRDSLARSIPSQEALFAQAISHSSRRQ